MFKFLVVQTVVKNNRSDNICKFLYHFVFYFKGYNYTAYAVLLNLINGTCNTMVLTNSTGAVIGSYQPDGRGSEFDLLCSADIEVPNQVCIKCCNR